MTIPTFVVAGAARAGTTALTEGLRSHPDCFVTTPKEPHYFAFAGEKPAFTGPGDREGINKKAITRREDYLALYRGAGSLVARGDGSASTLYYYDKAIAEIESINPAMRVVIVLRDPVERANSSFQYLRGMGRETVTDFGSALDLEAGRIAAGWHHLWHYAGMSHYADAVEAFVSTFGTAVHVVFYDDLVRDAEQTLASVYRHLGVDPGRAPGGGTPTVNASGQPRLVGVDRAFAALRRSMVVRSAVRRSVPYRTREKIRSWNLTGAAAPPTARARLRPMFAADLARLADVLGRELPPW